LITPLLGFLQGILHLLCEFSFGSDFFEMLDKYGLGGFPILMSIFIIEGYEEDLQYFLLLVMAGDATGLR